jgi:hypothetical protein
MKLKDNNNLIRIFYTNNKINNLCKPNLQKIQNIIKFLIDLEPIKSVKLTFL